MIDKTTLQPIPEGIEIEVVCYKCKQAPAVMFKFMRTPSGGTYRRGWCQACLDGVTPAREFVASHPPSGHQFRTGRQVKVVFEGKVRTFLHGKSEGMVQIQVGTRLYIVEEAWLQGE